MSDDSALEIRGDPEDATLQDIFIAGQPVGIMLERATERVKTLEDENETLRDRLAELQTRVGGIEDRTDAVEETIYSEGKDRKVREIVEYAKNQRGGDGNGSLQDAVVLTAKEIRGATGVSRRYSYDIIDEWPDDYGFLVARSNLDQYGELEIDQDAQKAGLAVVFNKSGHTDLESVNRFTTESDREGGSA